MSNSINIDAAKLLASNSFLRWGRMMVSLFINIYLWQETQDIQIIALYNIFILFFHSVWYFWWSYLVKFWLRNLTNALAYLWAIISYIFCIVFLDVIVDFIYYFAAFNGICTGLYYSNHAINLFDASHFKNRWNIEWLKKSIKIINKLVYPLVFGFLISTYSITTGFILWIILFIIWMILWHVNKQYASSKMQLIKFIWLMTSHKKILISMIASFFLTISFSATIIDFLISMILFFKTGTEFKMGASLSLVSLISIVVVYCFGKFVEYKDYNKWLIVFLVSYIIILLSFLQVESYSLVVLLSSLMISLIMLYQVIASVLNSNSLHEIKDFDDYKVEFYIIREIMYISGWIVWFIIIYFVWDLSQSSLASIFYTMILLWLVATWLYMKVNIHELDNN